MDRLDVTIVLPAYNEASHLVEEIDRIRSSMAASPYSFEILVVDDGSTDNTAAVMEDIEGVRYIRFLQNRGSGSVRRIGTQLARGTVVVWTDADMTYPNDRIPELVQGLQGWDQIVGARTSEEGTLKFFRVPAKWFVRKLASFLTSTKIPDLNSGFRAFRKDVAGQYLHLLPSGFSCVTTITLAFLSNGYSVKYVPIEYAKRAGVSKFHWLRDTSRYLLQVVRILVTYKPLRMLLPATGILVGTGLGKLVYDLATKDFRVATNTLVLLAAGITLGLIALLADVVVQHNRTRDPALPASATGPLER